jgi:hypothetical protein
MGRLTFHILDEQHREWFITCLFSHIHFMLTRQKVTSHPEALKIAMNLEESPIGDGERMAQVQSQLVVLRIHFS